MTLEVRVSNEVAKQLYRKYGFQMVGFVNDTMQTIRKMVS